MAFLNNTGVTRLVTDLKSRFAALTHEHNADDVTSGTLPVSRGGTGKGTHTANAVLTGNGTSAVNNVSTASGALYATAANGAAQFGTLPVAQGGTAGTTEAEARTSLDVPVNSAIATVEGTTATANHAIGDHFMLDDKLKKATAAIATGETISATNSADDTVQAQIDTLRDSVSELTGANSYDFNTIDRTCLLWCNNGSTNKPTSAGGFLITIQSGTPTVRAQLFTDVWSGLYARRREADGWGKWYKATLTVLS